MMSIQVLMAAADISLSSSIKCTTWQRCLILTVQSLLRQTGHNYIWAIDLQYEWGISVTNTLICWRPNFQLLCMRTLLTFYLMLH